jgi:RNA polymerase sigma factor for flagellar operon FliA
LNTKPSRDQLIMTYYPMVYRVARRMAARYPSSVDVDDLVSIGTMGLIDAAERFDLDLSTSFAGYARIRVQGAIVDALRKADWVPRSVRNRNRNITQARTLLQTRLGRAPSRDELAEELDLQPEALENYNRDANIMTLVSMEESRADSDQRISDTLKSDTTGPDNYAINQSIRGCVCGAITGLPDRDQQIIRLYYYEDRSFKEIGNILGVTESRVSQLHSRIKRRLREALDTEDLHLAA